MNTQDKPLSKFTVLDLTVARAGPVAVRLLADWGATVIRIEPPIRRDRGSIIGKNRGSDSQNLHRNKRSICLDLKSPEGREILYTFVKKADVVVENFRAEVKERLGLSYDQLRQVNGKIILASISGFGQDGPYKDRPGLDQILQGMSGLMSVTGDEATGPTRTGIAISDTTSGMFLGQGILLALLHREITGQGQWVHTSLLESMLSKLDFQGARYTMNKEIPVQTGNFHPTLSPMGTFHSKDGLVNIAASTDRMFGMLCDKLGCPEYGMDERFSSPEKRKENRSELDAIIEGHTKNFTSSELIDALNPSGIPCGPIYNIGQAFEDPQARHLKMVTSAEHPVLGTIGLVRSPINLSAFPHDEKFHHAGPDNGEHTEQIMAEMGFDFNEIEEMKQKGVIQ